MREELVAFLKRAADAGDVVCDLCDTGPHAGLVRSYEPAEVSNPELCAESILDQARSDATGKNGKIRYEVTATREGKRFGRHPIVIDTGIGSGSGSFGVEDANLPGILVELIRDKRLMMTMMVGSFDNMMGRMQTMLDLQAKQLIETEKTRIQGYEVVEDLIQHRHDRDIAAKRQSSDERAQDRMVETFVPLASVVANKLLGKATGEAAPLAPEMMGALLESLDEKQIEGIMSTLNPSQATAFLAFMQATAAAKEQKDAKEKKEYEARVNGSVNAGGGAG